DHPRQHRQPGGVEHLAGRRLAQVADDLDPPVAHADVGQAASGMVDHLAAAHDQIKGLGHYRVSASISLAAFNTGSTGRSIICWMCWFNSGSRARKSSRLRGPRTARPPHGPRTVSSDGPNTARVGIPAATASWVHRLSAPTYKVARDRAAQVSSGASRPCASSTLRRLTA